MIQGTVTIDGVPTVSLEIGGRNWPAIVDTGFNGDLELPEELRSLVNARFIAATEWALAGGQRSVEDTYEESVVSG